MVRAIEYTLENLPAIQEAYPNVISRYNEESYEPYANGLYYFVHDTNRMERNFVMTVKELAMVYDITPRYQHGKTTFFRID